MQFFMRLSVSIQPKPCPTAPHQLVWAGLSSMLYLVLDFIDSELRPEIGSVEMTLNMNNVTLSATPTLPSTLTQRLQRRLVVLPMLLLGLALYAGCSSSGSTTQSVATTPEPNSVEMAISDIEDFVLPTPTPAPEVPEDSFVVIDTGGSRANLRGGPNTDADIISKGYPGEAYEVISRSEDGDWWEICCAQGPEDDEGEATTPVWVAASVVTTEGAAAALAAGEPLLPDDLEATWDLDWQCGSTRCAVEECLAVVSGTVSDYDSGQWLPVEHDVAWADSCFPADTWAFEVDPYTGNERTGEFEDNFLYRYWVGTQPGEANGVYELEDGRDIAVWCSGPHSVEISEGDGWISVYEGETCHDVRTGLLVLLNYTKRWLYSGEFDGQTYERAYFGDSESLQQQLAETNMELLFVEPAE